MSEIDTVSKKDTHDTSVTESARVTVKKIPLRAHILGVTGELLITAGVLMGLYIAWQLWFTSWEANTQQSSAVTLATQDWEETPQTIGTPHYDEPPAFPHVKNLGGTIGVIHIPAFGDEWEYTILEGTSKEAILDKGAFGHYPETAFPGEIGNFSTAAHRNTYGAPMHYVENLKEGDSIIIETKDTYYVYKIIGDRYVVNPSQGEVIWPVPRDEAGSQNPTERLMTITTCHPYIGMTIERMITHAKLDHWIPRSEGIPEELAKK